MVSFHTFLSFAHNVFSFFLILPTTTSYLVVANPTSCTQNSTFRCSEVEREALLSFKETLIDPSGWLASWVGDDCCNWIGVGCENITSHIVKLDLRNPFTPLNEIYASNDDYEEAYIAYEKSCLKGKISSSLLDLKHLSYLDLSFNNFKGSNIPEFLGLLKSLKYLNLSFSQFGGDIPPHLGNLSRLEYLDLNSFSDYIYFRGLEVKGLQWLVNFPSLKYLNLGGAILERVKNWFEVINMLPFLLEVHLPRCGLNSLPSFVHLTNITSLLVLDLSGNYFGSPIPHWLSNVSGLSTINLKNCSLKGAIPVALGHLPNLRILNLGYNNLIGKIPSSFTNLCKLQKLYLSFNNISVEITELVDGFSRCSNNISSLEYGHQNFNRLHRGNLPYLFKGPNTLETIDLGNTFVKGLIPKSIGNLSSLQELHLCCNQMKGTIPKNIGKLSKLITLDLFMNLFEGVIVETHLQNLTRLKYLSLSSGFSMKPSLVLQIKHDWVPPFKLKMLRLSNVQVGPKFPPWLKTQNEVKVFFLNNVGISDTFPGDLWKSYSNILYWCLSHNKLQGHVPHLQFPSSIDCFDLSFNNFDGPLPIFHSNLTSIWLNNNMFSSPIPDNINELLPKLVLLDLSSNLIIGIIPHSIGMLKKLEFLVLRNNSLFAKLPPHWKDLQHLKELDLANNNISGSLPRSMRYLRQLKGLFLHQNHLHGEFPSFLRNYRELRSLDLGGNKFSGKLPTWVGESLSSLLILNLRSNLFHGDISQQLCLLSKLRILDIAYNEFSGAIPLCFGNLSTYNDNFDGIINEIALACKGREDLDEMVLVWKGREDAYINLGLHNIYSIDLSGNNLLGKIPENITSLLKLVNLNLSRNHLTGRIPEKIGNLRMLESLDLSKNELFGHIPESLSYLNFLSHLDLSFNNLSGRIPQGNQLQTLDNSSIYQGNPLLCGPPLSINCSKNEIEPKSVPIKKNGIELLFFYIGMIVGFIVGFWGVCGTLFVKTSWRQAYFGCFENLKDKIIVYVLVKVVCLPRKVKGERSSACG